MFCKWCGMESKTSDVCNWCHHSLSSTSETTEEQAKAEADAETLQHAEEGLAAGASAPQLRLSTEAEDAPSPVAPVSIAAAPLETSSETASRRPIIGVKRPGASGARPAAPAPVSPMTNRSTPPPARNPAPSANRPVPIAPILPVNRGQSSPSVNPIAAPAVPRQPAPAIRPVAPAPAAPINRAPAPARPVEANEQEEFEVGGLAAGLSAPNKSATSPADLNVPQLGTFEADKSKYYPGQVIDPVSGTHYDSETGKPNPAPTNKKRPEEEVVLNWDDPKGVGGLPAFGVAMLILIAVMWAAIAVTKSVIAPVLIANAIAGVLIPVMRIGPWQDDDGDDAVIFTILTLVFGAVPTLILYLAWSGIRSGGNASILGCAIVASIMRIVSDLATAGFSTASLLPPWRSGFTLGMIIASWSGIAALIGWIGANALHKADE